MITINFHGATHYNISKRRTCNERQSTVYFFRIRLVYVCTYKNFSANQAISLPDARLMIEEKCGFNECLSRTQDRRAQPYHTRV